MCNCHVEAYTCTYVRMCDYCSKCLWMYIHTYLLTYLMRQKKRSHIYTYVCIHQLNGSDTALCTQRMKSSQSFVCSISTYYLLNCLGGCLRSMPTFSSSTAMIFNCSSLACAIVHNIIIMHNTCYIASLLSSALLFREVP